MIRLFVLGPTSCVGPSGELEGVVRSSKRLALLSYLAIATPRGFHRRDSLLGMFWPESDQPHARGALRQTVRQLRQELGDVVEGRGQDELGLDWTRFSCDAAECRDAFEAGEWEAGLGLYRRDLLDGFWLSGAPRFEHWLETERMWLARRAGEAAWQLAERDRGEPTGVVWARRAARLAPFNESAVRKLMAYLDESGDAAGAVAEYERFARYLAEEAQGGPGVETLELVGRLREKARRVGPVREVETPRGKGRAAIRPAAPLQGKLPTSNAPEAGEQSATAFGASIGQREAPGSPRRRWSRLRAGSAVMASLAMVLVFLAGSQLALTESASAPSFLIDPQRLTETDAMEFGPSVSPDGSWVVYTQRAVAGQHLMLRSSDGSESTRLTADSPGDHHSPRWSPDGKQVAFVTQGAERSTLQVVVPFGGIGRSVYESDALLYLRSPTWAPDGGRLAFVTGNAIYVLDLSSGDLTQLVESRHPHSLAWSPDGVWIAFAEENLGASGLGSVYLGNTAPSSLRLLPVAGGEVRVLVEDGSLNASPMWSQNGRHLFFVSNRDGVADVYRLSIDGTGAAGGSPSRITTGLDIVGANLSRNGRWLVYGSFRQRANIWSVPIPGAESGPIGIDTGNRITTGDQVVETVALSTDGAWLAYDSSIEGSQDIFVMPVGGGDPMRITETSAHDFGPSFSPDAERIAFYSYRDGGRGLYVADVRSASVERITDTDAFDAFPDWSPDGLRMVFQRRAWGSDVPHLYLMERAGGASPWGTPRRLWDRFGHVGSWSPDGRSVLFSTDQDVRIVSASGGVARVVHDRPGFPRWSPDGRTIFVKESLGLMTSSDRVGIWGVPTAGGPARLLVRDPGGVSPQRVFATDGERFYVTVSEQESDIWLTELKPGG